MNKEPRKWDGGFDKEFFTPEEIEASDKRVDEIQRKVTCNWHNPDETGKYSCARFESPDGKQAIDMYFNGAQVTLRMEADGKPAAHMNFPIYYCPICGERVRMEAVPGAVD